MVIRLRVNYHEVVGGGLLEHEIHKVLVEFDALLSHREPLLNQKLEKVQLNKRYTRKRC